MGEPRDMDRGEGAPTTGVVPGGAGGEPPPERIGPYKILSVLGEGGFGIVYLAEQVEPVRRRVAVKVIKPGMDSRAVVARFEAERQALALMDHPNVARVLDVGTTDHGLPYFVMEHVAGVPITTYCERAKLDLRARLGLFVEVCGAVQHAHQKGVMHRDIKPSNILVEYADGRAAPKVIDFGVAKALGQPLTDTLVHTQAGQFIGTPEYMSPEQAEGSALDVDTRSDVYSLGVVLYELLTGALPFDGARLRESGQSEMVRTLREEEPSKPSARLWEIVSGQRAELTADRRAALRLRAGRLRGDLDWIVMRCLEKDRARRYSTPNGLAMDIQRFLSHEPVLAGPPSAAYRLRKFVVRNRAGVVAAGIVGAALVLAVVGTSVGFLRAEDARREEMRQRRTAEKMYSFLSDQFITAVSPEQMGGDVTMREVLDAAVPEIGVHFEGMPEAEAGVRKTFGETYFKLGAYPEALEQFTRAYELRRDTNGPLAPGTLEAQDGIGHMLLVMRRLDEAEPVLLGTMESRLATLGQSHEDTLDTMTKVAALRFFKGDLPGAIELSRRVFEARSEGSGAEHEETIRAASSLAELLRRRAAELKAGGSEDQSEAALAEAQSLLQRSLETSAAAHGEKAPITLFVMHNLAGFYDSRGDERAIPLMERTLALRREVMLDDHPRTLGTLVILANAHLREGRAEDAIRILGDVLTSARQRGAADRNARTAMRLLASTLLKRGRPGEAEGWCDAAIRAIEAAGEGESVECAFARRLRAEALRDVGRTSEAEQELRQAYEIGVRARGPEDGVATSIAADIVLLLEQVGGREDEVVLWRSRSGVRPREEDPVAAGGGSGGG